MLSPFFSKRRIHRALVKNGSEPVRLLSQTDILRIVVQKGETLGDVLNATMSQMKLVSEASAVLSISSEMSALDGFRLLSTNRVTALPVLLDDQLIATLSCSDLRPITAQALSQLHLRVVEYLASFDLLKDQVFVTGETSIKEATKLLVDNGIHRLWAVDNPSNAKGMHVISVVSVLDILNKLIES